MDYNNEIASLITAIESNPNIPVKNMLIAPSLATGDWTPEMVWDTGFLERFKDHISILTVEQYVAFSFTLYPVLSGRIDRLSVGYL